MLLKELLSFQKKPVPNSASHKGEHAPKDISCMKFQYGDAFFVVPINLVKEVIENYFIIPYPERNPEHIGLINLRGQILPVIRPSFYLSIQDSSADRLMLLEISDSQIFCIQAKKVQKISLSQEQVTKDVINIEQIPIKVIRETDFQSEGEDHACRKQKSVS